MHATDFTFNGQRASDFGLFIGGIDSDSATSGGNLSLNSIRTPSSDIFVNYSSNFDEPLEFTIQVVKLNCSDPNDNYLSRYEESMIAKWLIRKNGYHWLIFDQEGYEDIYYKVICTSLEPQQVGGKTIGYTIVFTSNCGYGFSQEIIKKQSFFDNENPINIFVNSDLIDAYIYPVIEMKKSIQNNYYIKNNGDLYQRDTEFNNMDSINNHYIKMDSENQIITCYDFEGDEKIFTNFENPDSFNFSFLRLVDGNNKIITNAAFGFEVEIKYREPRRVII